MSIKLQLPKMTDMRPRLAVMGIGGAGCNAINNMIASGLNGVDFVVANTDAQALASSSAERRIQLGAHLTEGLGAGSKPEVGEAAAEEALEELKSQIVGSHMLFIAAGMGGGTGTGAAAVVARAAQELGILTVAIVTKPFQFEGARRQRIAEIGISELRRHVDTLIVIPNQNLFRVANERTTFAEAFVMADQVLYSGVACIVDLIIKEGLINLDFADVRTVLAGMGTAMMGTGEAAGTRRAIEAAEEAIANPLLDDVSLRGARGLLLSISGGRDLTLYEVDEAASRVRAEVDPEANIIVGATFDDSLGDRVRVSIVASGMLRNETTGEPPQPQYHASSLPPYGGGGTHGGGGTTSLAREPDARHEPHALSEPLAESRHEPRGEPEMQLFGQVFAGPEPTHQPVQATPAAPARTDAWHHQPSTVFEEQDVQRRISDALQVSSFDDPPPPPASRRQRAEPTSDYWQGPGSVMIEEAPPLPVQPPPLRSSRPETAEPAVDERFVPERAVDVRRQTRRMPEIDDFPEVARREYRERMDEAPPPPPVRKPGLFERLVGRRDDSHQDQPPRDRAMADRRPDVTTSGRPAVRSGPGRPQQPASPADDQSADMPAVFRKDRR